MKRENIRDEWSDCDNNPENISLWSLRDEAQSSEQSKTSVLTIWKKKLKNGYDHCNKLQSILHLCTASYSFYDQIGASLQALIKNPYNSTKSIVLPIGPNDTKILLNTFNFFVVLEPSDISCWLATRCLASELHPLSLHNWWGKSSNLWLLRNT